MLRYCILGCRLHILPFISCKLVIPNWMRMADRRRSLWRPTSLWHPHADLGQPYLFRLWAHASRPLLVWIHQFYFCTFCLRRACRIRCLKYASAKCVSSRDSNLDSTGVCSIWFCITMKFHCSVGRRENWRIYRAQRPPHPWSQQFPVAQPICCYDWPLTVAKASHFPAFSITFPFKDLGGVAANTVWPVWTLSYCPWLESPIAKYPIDGRVLTGHQRSCRCQHCCASRLTKDVPCVCARARLRACVRTCVRFCVCDTLCVCVGGRVGGCGVLYCVVCVCVCVVCVWTDPARHELAGLGTLLWLRGGCYCLMAEWWLTAPPVTKCFISTLPAFAGPTYPQQHSLQAARNLHQGLSTGLPCWERSCSLLWGWLSSPGWQVGSSAREHKDT